MHYDLEIVHPFPMLPTIVRGRYYIHKTIYYYVLFKAIRIMPPKETRSRSQKSVVVETETKCTPGIMKMTNNSLFL